MNRKLIVGLFLAILGTVTPLGAQAPRVVAVRAGHLFDSKSGQMVTNQVVLITGEKISEVGAADRVQIPSGAQVIDLSQATVMPGFVDAHTHVYSSLSSGARVNTTKEAWTLMAIGNAQTTLRAGFTTVRDVGTHGEGYGDVDVRNAINRGLFDGPRMQVSTRGIGASGSDYIGPPGINITGGNQEIHGVEQAREVVREQIHYGADWIKVFPTAGYSFSPDGELYVEPTFTLPELEAMGAGGHDHQRKVAAHSYGGEGLRNSVIAGVDCIAHGRGLGGSGTASAVQ